VTKQDETGAWCATPLFVALLVVEGSDIIFAADSIPAIFGVTTDPYIVYTSNMCAILGLRSLYFILAEALENFSHIKYGLAAVLGFVAVRLEYSHALRSRSVCSLRCASGCADQDSYRSVVPRARWRVTPDHYRYSRTDRRTGQHD
jgi:tellurite resistance protein TerC